MAHAVNQGQQQLAGSLFTNQEELADSHFRLDEQFTVLTRLAITKMNELIASHNCLVETRIPDEDGMVKAMAAPREGLLVAPVTYESVNELFLMFGALRERVDYREHLRAFYMGDLKSKEDIENLPEPQAEETEVPEEVQKKNEDEGNSPVVESLDELEEGFPDGASFFGGDYGEEQQARDHEETPADGPGQAPQLHVVQGKNGDSGEPVDSEGGGGLREVQDLSGDHPPELIATEVDSIPEDAIPATDV